MPNRIRLTPLRLIIQTVRPNVAPSTINLRTRSIPTSQQWQRSPPIPRRALAIKRRRLPNAQRMADFMHGRALRHIRSVRAEA